MKFHCIADEDTVRGFRLAGIAGDVAIAAPAIRAAIRAVVDRADCGVLILTEAVAAAVRPLLNELRFEQERPLILEIPGPQGATQARKNLRQLVQEAVGIRLEPEKGD